MSTVTGSRYRLANKVVWRVGTGWVTCVLSITRLV
jgi:hypothetical protein